MSVTSGVFNPTRLRRSDLSGVPLSVSPGRRGRYGRGRRDQFSVGGSRSPRNRCPNDFPKYSTRCISRLVGRTVHHGSDFPKCSMRCVSRFLSGTVYLGSNFPKCSMRCIPRLVSRTVSLGSNFLPTSLLLMTVNHLGRSGDWIGEVESGSIRRNP